MNMTMHATVTLSNETATRLTPNGIHSGMDITIQNFDDAAFVYIGGEDVTTEDFGFRLSPGSAISFELPGKDALYAIADENETMVAVLKTNLESGS
jgi:hypothetical protein